MIIEKCMDVGWTLALRKNRGNDTLIDEVQKSEFSIISNPLRYWCADPFLFRYGGEEYIFCEAFDILKDKGVIGYRKISNGKALKLNICLECDCHLSYPYVFERENDIYMIPETGNLDKVVVYKAKEFPDKWEEYRVLLDGKTACDTNWLNYEGNEYIFTLIYDKTKSKYTYDELYMYCRNGDFFELFAENPVVKGEDKARNAGKFIKINNELFRVSQNCAGGYGQNLVFSKVDILNKNEYREHIVKEVYAKDLKLNKKNIYDGVHTYNMDDNYEIIDLKRERCFRIERVLFLVANKIKRLFKLMLE